MDTATLDFLYTVAETVDGNLEERRNAEGEENRAERMEQLIPITEEFGRFGIDFERLKVIATSQVGLMGDPQGWAYGVLYGLTLAERLDTVRGLEEAVTAAPSA